MTYVESKRRASCARGWSRFITPALLALNITGMSVLTSTEAKAVEAASINATAMTVPGGCVAGDQTGFHIDYTVDPDTNDVINSDTHTLYLLDLNNKVLDSRNLDVFRWNGDATNYTTVLFTKKNPTGGPFKVLIHDNASLQADFTNGSTFSAPSDKIKAEYTLDANAFNASCPAENLVTENTGGGSEEEEETQDSQNVEDQQEELTTTIINQQTTSIATGVTNNINSLFTGRGTDPVFNPGHFTSNSSSFNGNFSLQSTGLRRWIRERKMALAAREARKNEARYGLRQSAMHKQKQTKFGFFDAGEEIAAEDMVGTYNWWIKGSGTYFNGKGHSYDGTQFDIVSGIDYRLSEHIILGFLMGYGLTDFDLNNSGTDGTFKANGYSVGPYIGLQLDKALFAEALIVYTRSDYESTSGSLRGDFDADRITAVVNLRGRYELGGGVIVEPGIGFLYAHEKQEAYRDSGGTTHSALTVKAGRLSIGPKITLPYLEFEDGKISPWFAIKGEYDFSNQSRAANSSLPDQSSFVSLRTQLGVDNTFTNGTKISLKLDASGLLSDKYLGLGGHIRYDMPF